MGETRTSGSVRGRREQSLRPTSMLLLGQLHQHGNHSNALCPRCFDLHGVDNTGDAKDVKGCETFGRRPSCNPVETPLLGWRVLACAFGDIQWNRGRRT